jgi:membrane protein YqaA with SNARE-associated domain
MAEAGIYGGLFLSALVAATLLPGGSEALLAGFLVTGKGDPTLLIAAATIGNVLGSVINWYCGRFLARFRGRKWFPISERRYEQAVGWFEKYGLWSLLFAWAPVVGDPLTVIAGALRIPFPIFIALVSIGKLLRYLTVAALALAWVGS